MIVHLINQQHQLKTVLSKSFVPRCEKNCLGGFPTRSDTNQAVQPKKMAGSLKFRICKVEGFYFPFSKNKGADQLRGNGEADLRLCFRICKKPVFSHRGSFIVQLGQDTPSCFVALY